MEIRIKDSLWMKDWWKIWAAQPALWLRMQDPCAHSQRDGAAMGTSYSTKSDPQSGGCLHVVQVLHISEGGTSCSGALLCSEVFCCNSVFSQSQPGKFELTVPNAALTCLLMLIVKPWQKHSPSGLQKSCRIRCLPTRWALLRDVIALTTTDSSWTPLPSLLCVLRARQQPELRAEGRQELTVPMPTPRAWSRGPALAWAPAPQVSFVFLTFPPPPTSLFLPEHPAAPRCVQ